MQMGLRVGLVLNFLKYLHWKPMKAPFQVIDSGDSPLPGLADCKSQSPKTGRCASFFMRTAT